MRIAIFSDTHGNSLALEAVLADVADQGGADGVWFLGDAAPIGFDPAGTVALLRGLQGLRAVRGNGDSRIATDPALVREGVARHIAAANPHAAAGWRSLLSDSEWAREAVQRAGHYDWLASLPLEERLALPDGTRVLMVHASPGTDSGPGVEPDHTDDDIRPRLTGADADLLLVGHTHALVDRTIDGVRIVNPGSVSNPPLGGNASHWMLLEADSSGHTLTRMSTTYDLEAMLHRLDAAGHPDPSHIREFWAS